MGWWVSDWFNSPNGPVIVASWVTWVIGSIVLHELAHGWAAIWQGDRTPIELGHMTWNPLVHMGWFSLIAFLVIGIAWGAMPVNPSRFRSRYGDAYVSLAGPLMNVVLIGVATLGMVLVILFGASLPGSAALPGNLLIFFTFGIMLNVVLALFNMMPIPPLDGSRILSSVHPPYARIWEGENAQWIGLGAFFLLFMFGSDLLFGVGLDVAIGIRDGLLGAL